MILVSFACNDPDNGSFTGKVDGIEVHGAGCDLTLECPNGLGGVGPRLERDLLVEEAFPGLRTLPGFEKMLAARREDRAFRLRGKVFPCYGWKEWYGNWCWDATRMAAVEVLGLLRHLRDCGWHCTEASCAFSDAWENGAELTPELLHDALSAEEPEAA